MAEAEVTKSVAAPIEAVWRFTSDMNNWAPLVTGYQSHQQISDRESMWTLKGQFGGLQKAVTFRVQIVKWVEPSMVAFTLKATNENVSGSGHFIAEPMDGESAKMKVRLELKPGGFRGPVVNAMLKPVIPKMCDEFATSLVSKIEETNRAPR